MLTPDVGRDAAGGWSNPCQQRDLCKNTRSVPSTGSCKRCGQRVYDRYILVIDEEWALPDPLFLFGATVTKPAAHWPPIENDEPRLMVETGVDARVAQLIEPVMNAEGFRLVRVRLSGRDGATLQIMAERLDSTMTVTDCEQLSRTLSPLLDVEDPIAGTYRLEVSSPGIDRPLVRVSDFAKWRGHLAKVETSVMVGGRKRFRGIITDVSHDALTLFRDQPAMGEPAHSEIPFSAVADARLILTDDLIRASLDVGKKARQARGEDNEFEDDAAGEQPQT